MTITETFWSVGNHYRILNNLFLQFKYTCHFYPALTEQLIPPVSSLVKILNFPFPPLILTYTKKQKLGLLIPRCSIYNSYPVWKSFLRKRIVFHCARERRSIKWGSWKLVCCSSFITLTSKSYDIIRLGPPMDQGAVRALFSSWL